MQKSSKFSLQKFLQPLFNRQTTKEIVKIATAADKINLNQEFGIGVNSLQGVENWIEFAFSVSEDKFVGEEEGEDDELWMFEEIGGGFETILSVIARNVKIEENLVNKVQKESIYQLNNVDPFSLKKGNKRSRNMK